MNIRSFNTVILSLYSIFYYWPLGTQSSCPSYAYLTCPQYKDTSRPGNEFYLVQPSPVQFTIEPQDIVFFDGSDISLYCETNCAQPDTSCSVGFLYNRCNLDYTIEQPWVLSNERVIGRRTLTIHNANSTANGIYQCFTYSPRTGYLPLTDRVIGRPIHLQVAALEPVGEEIQIVNVSEGGSIELPCMKGVFPNPSNISWWWNEDQCQSPQCQENIKILPSGALVLTNITINMSGDYFYCEIGWNDHMTTYNATYQMIVDISMNSTDSSSTKTMETLQKTGPPTIVSLNATIDHVSKGSAIYYKSDLLVDLHNNVDDYLINGAITCTFSGHPRPQVKWFLNGLNISECIDTTNIVTEGNTSVLYFNTTNPKSYFGSYQCVVDNEVGYASNTTRILPKGWSNPPDIISVRFHGTDVTIKWGSPDYTGGRTVKYYAFGIKDLHLQRPTIRYLDIMTESVNYTFEDIQDYYRENGNFNVQFTIEVVNDRAQAVSDIATVALDSYPNSLQLEINSVDCTGRNVVMKWTNRYQDAYSNIWDHCVYYNCSTLGGDVTGEMCTPYLSRNDGFGSRQTMELDNVPLNGKCSFRVMVYAFPNTNRWSNYETCTRNLSLSVVTSRMIDQVHTAGDEVTFTCQATGEPISSIRWYFNNITVNESDKYKISTELLNYTSKISELTVNSVESSDVGTYTCYATNGISEYKSSGVLSVNVAPVVTIPGTERTFNATESDRITCTAEGYPTPDIIWLNNNRSEVDKDRLVTSSVMATGVGNITSKSVAINIRRDDSGIYTCIANNSVGNNTRIINITVQSIPIVAIQEEYTVNEGGNITCEATGYPVPDIVWLNDDGSVVNGSRVENSSAVATGVGNLFSMSVSMIVRRGDGGVYTCVASNPLGSNNSSVNITVESLPVINMPRAEQAYDITEGDKITCRATGYPVPDIEWLNNNGSVVNESRIENGSAVATGVGNLFSMSVSMVVRRGDGGVYTCVASNPLGSDNSSVNITVQLSVHSASDVAIWVGVSLSLLLLSLLVLLLTIGVLWIRRRKYRAKSVIINQDFLKGLDGTTDYDKLPKDNDSLVETISVKSKSMLGSMISIITDVHIDMILGPPDSPIFSFLDINSESGDTEMNSDWSGISHDHYTTSKLHSSTTVIDSAATSATTTGSTNVDSGIDSHNKFSV